MLPSGWVIEVSTAANGETRKKYVHMLSGTRAVSLPDIKQKNLRPVLRPQTIILKLKGRTKLSVVDAPLGMLIKTLNRSRIGLKGNRCDEANAPSCGACGRSCGRGDHVSNLQLGGASAPGLRLGGAAAGALRARVQAGADRVIGCAFER